MAKSLTTKGFDAGDTLWQNKQFFRLTQDRFVTLLDQDSILAQSGLGDAFHGVEIVSEKTPQTYRRAFAHYGAGPGCALMAGNSLKSDVIEALKAGCWGVHIPHELSWALVRAAPPSPTHGFDLCPASANWRS